MSFCIYLVRPSSVSVLHPTWHRTFTWMRTGSRHRPWNSLTLYLSETIGVTASLDSAIGTGFYKLLSVFAILYTLRMSKFHMPTLINHRNNSKRAPISLYFVQVSSCLSAIFSMVNFYAIQDTRLFHILTSFVHVYPVYMLATSASAVSLAVNCERV